MVRFPLGSGINGNVRISKKGNNLNWYASLWEVELMETAMVGAIGHHLKEYASLWEVELMETLAIWLASGCPLAIGTLPSGKWN